MRHHRRIVAGLCLLALAACSAGGGQLPSTAHVAAIQPRAARGGVIVSLRSGGRVASATKSIAFTFTDVEGTKQEFAFDTTAGSPNCAAAKSETLCRLDMHVSIGRMSMATSTYNGPLDGKGLPTGSTLSSNFVLAVNVRPQNHAIAMTDESDAVPATVSFGAGAGSEITPSSTAYLYPKCALAQQNVYVATLDASGAYIIGPNAPKLTLAVDNDRVTVQAAGGNTFTLVQRLAMGARTVALAAKATSRSASVQRAFALKLLGGNDICGIVTATFQSDEKAGFDSVIPAAKSEWFVESDAYCTDIFDWAPGNAGGTYQELCPSSGYPTPYGIAFGSDGLWFTDCNNQRVGHLDVSTRFYTVSNLGRSCGGMHTIVEGPDKAMWFTTRTAIDRIDAYSGSVNEYPIQTGGAEAVASAGGAIWFSNPPAHAIGKLATDGTMTEFTVPGATYGPSDLITGPDGALWFTDNAGVGRMTTNGAFSKFNVDADGLAAGPDGTVWFVQSADSIVGHITSAGVVTERSFPGAPPSYYNGVSDPRFISRGPDDSIWVDSCANCLFSSMVEIR